MPQIGYLPRQTAQISALVAPRAVLRFYRTGTSTPQNAYTDSALSNAVTSLTADSAGLFPAWYLNPSAAADYRYTLETEAGALYWTQDNIARQPFTQSDIATLLYPQTAEELAAGVTPTDYAIPSHDATGHVIPQRYYPAASPSTSQMYTVLSNAWAVARQAQCDIYAPAGTYDVGINNLPFKNPVNSSLLDCYNITIRGDGPSTIFKTSSVDGADVFQLNAVKNLHLRNLSIQATISGTTAGSNGISVTNGFDNITIDEVHCLNLPSLDKTTYVDGGKALTIQPSTTSNECGTLKARIYATGCAEGFGIEVDLNTADDKKTAVDVDIVAERCFYAVKVAAGAATAALSSSFHQGIRVRGQAINCQKDVVINRAHGADIDIQVITTTTELSRRLNPSSVAWFAADNVVESLLCIYAHRSQIKLTGNKGACAYKARIGGTTAGSSGLTGATDDCDIYLDLGGTASSNDVLQVDSGGNTMSNTRLAVSVATATTLPSAFYSASLGNRLTIGAQVRGSYTGTLTGCTTSPTASIEYSIEGDLVVLKLPSLSATSNTTAATVTGMPTTIRPLAAQDILAVCIDDGTSKVSRINVGTDGVLTLYNSLSPTFTNTGTKGIQSCTAQYRRV